jgi:hypothetical protein
MVNLNPFIEYTEQNLILDLKSQEHSGMGSTSWTSDDWTLAVADCLNVGIENYQNDRVDELNYHRDIIIAAERKYKMFDVLSQKKDSADSLLIAEIGRGLDIIFALLIKEWKTIYCYDQFDYEKYLNEYFLECNIVYSTVRSKAFDVSMISEPCIMISNMSKMEEHDYKIFEDCKYITHIIKDGVLTYENI